MLKTAVRMTFLVALLVTCSAFTPPEATSTSTTTTKTSTATATCNGKDCCSDTRKCCFINYWIADANSDSNSAEIAKFTSFIDNTQEDSVTSQFSAESADKAAADAACDECCETWDFAMGNTDCDMFGL